MAEVPTSAWLAEYDLAKAVLDAPLEARWRRRDGLVRHVFTHFPLELAVFVVRVGMERAAPEGMRWTPRGALGSEPLPNLMKKVLAHAFDETAPGVTAPKPRPRPSRA